MISLKNVSLAFGGQEIFKDISLDIRPADKIGLIGRNGIGKSTLLKIITGEITPDSGSVSVPKDLKIGYLPQHLQTTDKRTLIEETLTAFDEVKKLRKEYERLNHELQNRSDYDSEEYLKIIDKITAINERLDVLEADKILQYATETLKGLGFKEDDFDRHTSEFSGGWRMRIELAKILLQNPDVLLLDEPTNHLDIVSIQWLEGFLKEFKGSIVLISHDKRFLDEITNRTVEISFGKLYDLRVPYSEFQKIRQQQIELQKAQRENQLRKLKQTERFIERFRYKATKASQVQARVKMLEKTEVVEVEEQDIRTMKFKFADPPRSGDIVLEIRDLTKKYGELLVLDKINLTVERGEKIAFVGRNGEGKTTLARIIVGELDYDGFLKIGHNVKIGYFAQNQELLLDTQKTVLQTLEEVAPVEMTEARLRGVLGAFLFGNDDVTKKVGVLSGGEKARLALARLVLQPYNLLVLDEPTNHLDIYAKDILKQALQQFNGTVITISHDRDFLKNLAQTVYEFENHKIRQYKGDIDYFLEKKKAATFYDFEISNLSKTEKRQANKKQSNKELYLQKKEQQKKLRKIEKQISLLEAEIEKLEQEIAGYHERFSRPNTLSDEDFKHYNELQKNLENKMKLWEELSEKLEEMRNEMM